MQLLIPPVTWWVDKIEKMAEFIWSIQNENILEFRPQIKIFAKNRFNIDHYFGILATKGLNCGRLHRELDAEDKEIIVFMFNDDWLNIILVDMYEPAGDYTFVYTSASPSYLH